jgi:hypothetical protein
MSLSLSLSLSAFISSLCTEAPPDSATCSLLNDNFSVTENGRISELRIGNEVEGNDRGLILLYYLCLKGLRKSPRNLSKDNQFLGQGLNPGQPEYKRVLETQPRRLVIDLTHFVHVRPNIRLCSSLILQFGRRNSVTTDCRSDKIYYTRAWYIALPKHA